MRFRDSVIATAVAALLTTVGAQAADNSKYPDLKGNGALSSCPAGKPPEASNSIRTNRPAARSRRR
jgi:hypothetical protein